MIPAIVLATAVLAVASPAASPAARPSEIGHVVTSDRRDEPLSETSKPTFVIDRPTIEAFGARSVADALRAVPGLTIFSYGGFGAQSDYGIRGTSAEQTLVLLDGVPISTASSGLIDLGGLSTAGVERIEVVESGGSTLYGTSATGGIINIITAVPRSAYAEVAAGSYGDQDLRAGFGNGAVGLSIERHIAGNAYGYPAFLYGGVPCNAAAAPCFPAGTRTNAFALQNDARLDLDLPLPSGWRTRGSAGISAISLGVPGRLDALDAAANQRVARFDAVAEVSHAGAASQSSLTLAGSRQALAFVDLSPAFGGESDTYESRAQLSLKNVAGTGNVLTYGLDLSRESANLWLGPGGPPPSFAASEAQSALYAQQSVALGGASRLYAGLRGENDSPHGTVLAPSGGGTLGLGALRLQANAGESYRVPTLVELYYPGFANPNLVPERATNLDATLSLPMATGDVALGWFGRYASNLITLDANFVPQNTQQATIGGAILTAGLRPGGFRVTASVMNLYRAIDESPGAGGARLQRTPFFTGTLDLERPFRAADRFAYGLRVALVGADHDNGGLPGVVAFYDGRTTLDLFGRYKLAGNLVLTVRGRNLGDAQYAPVFGYPAPGRTLDVEFASR